MKTYWAIEDNKGRLYLSEVYEGKVPLLYPKKSTALDYCDVFGDKPVKVQIRRVNESD